jgi:glycosyltransferase involved in cell wall biosynthesis
VTQRSRYAGRALHLTARSTPPGVTRVRIGIVTREWPPDVYGGAGVHIEHLVAALRSLPAGREVDVHCFGEPRSDAKAHAVPAGLREANGALQAVGVDAEITAALGGADPVHSHPWYANGAGMLAALVHGIPHVVTAHSLEPRPPWKADQLGGGYRLSYWVERSAYLAADAVIAVSHGMRTDVLDAYPDLTRHASTSSATASTPTPTGRCTTRTSSVGSAWTPTAPTRSSSGGSPGRRA